MRVRFALLALLCAGSTIAACVIGPKQDDPASGSPDVPTVDTGTAGGGMDGGVSADNDAGDIVDTGDKAPSTDALSTDAQADAATDARSDAPSSDAVSTDAVGDAASDGDATAD